MLSSLTDDILDVAQMKDYISIRKESFPLLELVENCVDMVAVKAYAKHLDIGTYVSLQIEKVFTDYTRMRQVLLNLLTNSGTLVHP